MSRIENGLKVTVLTQSANFFLPDTLKVTGSTISTPKSYDEHPRQVKYGSPPPPLAKQEDQLARWSGYFEGLLNRPTPPVLNVDTAKPSKEEIKRTNKEQKNGKSPGSNDIPIE